MRKLDPRERDNWGADRIEAELEAARDGLRGLDRNIRKILGRDLPDTENGGQQQSPRVSQKRTAQEDRRRQQGDFVNNDGYGGKRRWQGSAGGGAEPKTVFSRLSARVPSNPDDSGDEDDMSKPAVSSRVIAPPREVPSRQEVIRRERVDERSRQRNKRMFGALLGTLQKFRQEETKLKAKEDKKAEVEARVEEAKRKEREELRKERQQLFSSRKRQLAEVRALETKLARSQQFQDWRATQLPLVSFIRTRAQPAIYYLPKRKHPNTDILLEQSAKELLETIAEKEKALVQELEIIDSQLGLPKQHVNANLDNNMTDTAEEEKSESSPTRQSAKEDDELMNIDYAYVENTEETEKSENISMSPKPDEEEMINDFKLEDDQIEMEENNG